MMEIKLVSNIEYCIEQRGFKKKYVADRLGVSVVVLSRWINNHSKPSLENAFRLSVILDCTVDDLFKVE